MSLRILVIEDEPGISDFILRGLREEGYRLEHAGNGVDGWHQLHTQSWDLVLLDWWLPGEDGLSLLERFRQSGGTAPVLFLTARDAVRDRVRGLNGGADDYLCKPFAFEELLARVRCLTRRHERRPDLSLAYGDVSIDLATQRVERGGHPLDLTAKEKALLILFLRHPGEMLSRTRIYEHIWSDSFDGVSNTLEVHIMELRRKLERFGPRIIVTVRGQGYALGTGVAAE